MSGPTSAARGLQLARRAAGLSQEQLAERAAVSERTVRSLESGRAKRPHRDTLLALGTALGLTDAALDDFVDAWRHTTRALHELFHGRAPEDALREEFARQRSMLRERLITLWLDIGPDRNYGTMTVRRTFDVVDGEVDRFLWIYGVPVELDASRLEPVECVNVEPIDAVDGLDIGGATAKAFLGALAHTLRAGDEYTLGYEVDYAAALPDEIDSFTPDSDILFAVPAAMQLLMLEVRFDPRAVPARAWHVRHDVLGGPQVQADEVSISSFGVLHLVLAPVPAGVHGLRWDWDG